MLALPASEAGWNTVPVSVVPVAANLVLALAYRQAGRRFWCFSFGDLECLSGMMTNIPRARDPTWNKVRNQSPESTPGHFYDTVLVLWVNPFCMWKGGGEMTTVDQDACCRSLTA